MITVSPTGTSPDDANRINAALKGAASEGVMLSAGVFAIGASDQIIWPAGGNGISLIGEGMAASRLVFASRSSDGMVIPGPNSDCCIRDIGFNGGGAGGSYALLHITNAHNIIVDRVQIDGIYWDGIAIDGGPQQFKAKFTNIDVDAVPGTGYRAIVVGENALVQDLYLTMCATSQTTHGIWLQNVSGFYELNSQCYAHSEHGLITAPQAGQGQVCEWFQCTGHLSDSCGQVGVYLTNDGAGGIVRGITFTNLWSSSNNVGIELGSGVDDVQISGRRILVNRVANLIDNGATNVHWWPGPP